MSITRRSASTDLTSRWDDSLKVKPRDFKVIFRKYEWVDEDDHSQGVNELTDTNFPMDLTDYDDNGVCAIEWNDLPEITLEMEDRDEAGTIKASQFRPRISDVTGTVLPLLLADTVGSDNVHIWLYEVYIGNRDEDDWFTPPLKFVVFMRPTATEAARFENITYPDPQHFELPGFDLLYWAAKYTSDFLGDRSNISGYYYDDGDAYAGDLEKWIVCNRPLIPLLYDALNELGIEDDNVNIEGGVDAGDQGDYSTIDIASTGSSIKEALPVFRWKAVNNADYWVWAVGDQAARTLYVSAVDTVTGVTIRQSFTVGSEAGLSTYRIKRMWYTGSGHDFYVLLKVYNSWAYAIVKVTLSNSTIGNITKSEETYTIDEPTNLRMFWLQCDLDTVASPLQLWCTRQHTSSDYVQLGYYDTSTEPMTWTTLKTYSSSNPDTGMAYDARIWYDQGFADHTGGDAAGGLRVLRSSGGDYAVAFMGWINLDDISPTDERGWHLCIYYYDDSKTEVSNGTDYDLTGNDFGGSPIFVKDNEQARHPITGGRGSLGGFYNSTDDLFFFAIPSIETRADGGTVAHAGIIKYWGPGASWSITSDTISDSNGFTFDRIRSFSSSGTANYEELTTGWIQYTRQSGTDYLALLEPFTLSWNDGTNALREVYGGDVIMQIADGTTSNPRRKWPELCAPSLTVGVSSSGGTDHDVIEDRAFLIQKSPSDIDTENNLYLTIYSQDWYWNYAINYEGRGSNLADEFQMIAEGHGLFFFLTPFNAIIVTRDYVASANEMELETSDYYWNQQSKERSESYDYVEIIDIAGSTSTYPASGQGKKLSTTNDYVLPTRADARAEALYNLWKDPHWVYELLGTALFLMEPSMYGTVDVISSPDGDHEIVSGLCTRVNITKDKGVRVTILGTDAAS